MVKSQDMRKKMEEIIGRGERRSISDSSGWGEALTYPNRGAFARAEAADGMGLGLG